MRRGMVLLLRFAVPTIIQTDRVEMEGENGKGWLCGMDKRGMPFSMRSACLRHAEGGFASTDGSMGKAFPFGLRLVFRQANQRKRRDSKLRNQSGIVKEYGPKVTL